ncbi:MAG TPA: YciI family protein [Mycobacterium sp.]|nr:YciI family protein [Mycobacterium sp.]
MVYMLMIYSREADWAHGNPEKLLATLEAHKELENEMRAAGTFRGGGGLALTTSATTVRFRGGHPTLTDGPFAETKEQFGGFYLVETDTLEEAVAYAQRIPGVENRAIEVRAVTHHSPL